MPGRTLLLVAILVLVATAPFLLSKKKDPVETSASGAAEGVSTKLASVWRRVVGEKDGANTVSSDRSLEEAQLLLAENRRLLLGQPVNTRELGGIPGVTLADALRFDVTPAWVSATWPRVTPQRMETGWYAVRVPLVTGTDTDDIAGSLTYYFNPQNFVERITLYGYTGDAEPLITLVQQQYHLQPLTAAGRGLYFSFYEAVPIGILKVEDAPIQSMDGERNRYRIELELNLPRPGASLSDEVMERIRRLRDAKLL